jgi:hypothetical protein
MYVFVVPGSGGGARRRPAPRSAAFSSVRGREVTGTRLRSLKGDSLSVRCDVTVQSVEKESRIKCSLRGWLQQ